MTHNNVPSPDCIICGAEPQAFLACDDLLTAGGTFHIVRCAACGFLWTADAPDLQGMAPFYGDRLMQSIHPQAATPALRAARLALQSWLRARFVRRVCGRIQGNLLDIGCGTGDFLHAMRRLQWQCTGCERTSSQQVNGIITPEDAYHLKDNSFDAVTLWHALEHLHGVTDWLQNIRRILRPDGTCVIAVPNAASRQARDDHGLWFGYDVPRHLWHFTPDTLSALLQQNGMRTVCIRPMRADPFVITLLMLYIHKRPFIRGMLRSLLRDVLTVRTAQQAPCMLCVAKPL